MSEVSYRLEIVPTAEGASFYNNENRSNDNAGFDMFCVKGYTANAMINSEKPVLLDLGASVRMVRIYMDGKEEEVHYWLCPRSSIIKTGLMMANSQGVIDKTYRGTLMGPVQVVNQAMFTKNYLSDGVEEKVVFKGERLFQIVAPDMGWIKSVYIVASLPTSERGAGGFGSTGK